MKSTKVKRLGAGRVAFLARIEIFKEKIIAGHTIASVFEEYEKDLGGIGYKQFVNYVNKFIRSKPSVKDKGEKSDVTLDESGTLNRETKKRTGIFELNTDTGEKRKKDIV